MRRLVFGFAPAYPDQAQLSIGLEVIAGPRTMGSPITNPLRASRGWAVPDIVPGLCG